MLADPRRYLERYAEADKSTTGLGDEAAAWRTPYWLVDGGMVVHTLLLGAVDAGLGALLFGLFAREEAVRAALGSRAANIAATARVPYVATTP